MTELIDFKQLKLERVIDESHVHKTITFLANYKGNDTVVRLEKTPFNEESLREALAQNALDVERSLLNDIYSRYKLCSTNKDVNNLKVILVTPASQPVVVKYSRNEAILFKETAETFEQFVEPYIKDMLIRDKDYNKWVYNILEGKSETDQVLLNHPGELDGFMLLPSLKSSGDENDLHILAICHRRDINSLRDLNGGHLPLLENIQKEGSEFILNRYGSKCVGRQLRAFIHYHPTFYHFHVHFQMVDAGQYSASDRDNLLDTVISNIRLLSNYYKMATLTFPLTKASGLFKELKEKKCIDIV